MKAYISSGGYRALDDEVGTYASDSVIGLSHSKLYEFGESGKIVRANHLTSKLRYASCTKDIPRSFKGEFDTSNKRPNPKARKRAAAAAAKKKRQRGLF